MIGLITQYGLALIFANVLIQQMGLPIPVTPTLIVAGALAADGRLSALAIFVAAFTACAISDAIWYAAGRLYGRRAMKFLCQLSLSPDSCVQQSEYQFHRWGALSLVLAKFVPGLSIIMQVDQWLDQVPTDREVIFYCTCPDEAGAAHVARKLLDLGYTRVRPLLGGMDAWIAAGYQVDSGSVASAYGASTAQVSPTALRSA